MRAAFVDVNGIQTRYLFAESDRDARPLLLLHGFGLSADSWLRNVDELAATRPVFAPDCVGHGFTEPVDLRGEPAHGVTLSHLLGWVDVMGWEEFDVVGSSFGGLMAALLYLKRPESVRRVVIVGSGSSFLSEDELINLLEDRSRNHPATDRGSMTLDMWRDQIAEGLSDPSLVPEEILLVLLTSYAIPSVQKFQLAAEEGKLVQGALRPYLIGDRLAELTAPILVIWGREDPSRWEYAAEAVGQMPSAELVVFDACGHLPYIDDPERFNGVVKEFLGQED